MEISKLEELNDRTLYRFCHLIENKLDGETPKFDDNFFYICDYVGKMYSYRFDYIDYDFILNLLALNDFNDKSPKKIIRPEISKYGFDYDEFVTQFARNTYFNTISTYSKRSEVFDLVQKMTNDGNFEYYEGNVTDSEVYDSETTDVKLDRSSLKELKV